MVGELDDKDVEFLAGDTGQPAERIRFMVAAHRASAKVDDLPAEAFYAWQRDGQPADLEQLLARSPDILRAASSARAVRTSSPARAARTSRAGWPLLPAGAPASSRPPRSNGCRR